MHSWNFLWSCVKKIFVLKIQFFRFFQKYRFCKAHISETKRWDEIFFLLIDSSWSLLQNIFLKFWIPCFLNILQSIYKWSLQWPQGGKGLNTFILTVRFITVNNLNIKNNKYFIGCVAEFNKEELYDQQIQLNSGLTYDRVFLT